MMEESDVREGELRCLQPQHITRRSKAVPTISEHREIPCGSCRNCLKSTHLSQEAAKWKRLMR